jgi:RimJ/RimL family protein N-acetyltransferase
MSELRQVPFDEEFLDLSYGWLHDDEIARLTLAQPFSREAQRAWWEGLPGRTDYVIWGVECDGVKIGAFGFKDLGKDEGGEGFVYIGRPEYWGKGVAPWMYDRLLAELRARGLTYLYGTIAKSNVRSLDVHQRLGVRIAKDLGDAWWVIGDVD